MSTSSLYYYKPPDPGYWGGRWPKQGAEAQEEAVLSAFAELQDKLGYPPGVQELARYMRKAPGCYAPFGLALGRLVRKGKLIDKGGMARPYRLVKDD